MQQRQLRPCSSTGRKPAAAAAADAQVVRQFMERHCTQLTPFGLESLAVNLKEHQLAVFFRWAGGVTAVQYCLGRNTLFSLHIS